jgi:SAM-dependent methyltransferase
VRWIDHFKDAYLRSSKRHLEQNSSVLGASVAVGGSFDAIGYLENRLLKQHGLAPEHCLVDVGCGSGRLLSQLTPDDVRQYLGTDISAELLDHCRQFLKKDSWMLRQVENCEIPLDDGTADMVCMFSVITHLLHQQSYLYFKEAARVLKPGGKLIVSFLEFRHQGLWPIFDASVDSVVAGGPLDTFVDRDGLKLWAHHSSLELCTFIDGDTSHIPIDREIEFDNGIKVSSMARLGPTGQSIAIFKRRI